MSGWGRDMEQILTEAEEYVAELVWERKSLSSGELVRLCAQQLDWKKSTTYTILKRLERKGVLRNENGQVEALISREEYQSLQGCRFIDGSFGGSLPSFLAAFTRKRKLSGEEVRQLREMIEQFEEEP